MRLPKRKPQPAQVVAWELEHCPQCGRPVYFLPGQQVNTCGWCGTVVMR